MTNPLRWRPLALLTVAVVLVALAAGCQKKEQAPPQPQGAKPAAGPTAQMPQSMLDALHGKQPEGPAPGAPMMPPGGMPPQGMPPQGMAQGMPPGGGGMGMPKVARQVIVPEAVKRSWKGIVVQVAEAGKGTKDYQVPIHGQLAIPGSGLTLTVEDFLPDFKMTPQGITSLSNEPKNPAAKVVVVEGGKPIFKGWLFKLFPEAHPFQHPKYHLVLKSGVAA